MAGCGCKSKGNVSSDDNVKFGVKEFGQSIYVRLIIFTLSFFLVLLSIIPLVIPMLGVLLFNKIVLGKDTNFTKIFTKLGNKLRSSDKRLDDDVIEDDDNEEINPDEFELMDVDVIK